jgi:hypothetical protein
MESLVVAPTLKSVENNLRYKLKRRGFTLKKSRIRHPNVDNQGGYMILDNVKNEILAGTHYDLSLNDVEDCVK